MLADGQCTKCRRKIAENYNRLSTVHERYRQQTTDGRATANSERDHVRKNQDHRYVIARLTGASNALHAALLGHQYELRT